jgi:hypothetical protein
MTRLTTPDAAVQFVNETIAMTVWNALSQRNDGTATKYNP